MYVIIYIVKGNGDELTMNLKELEKQVNIEILQKELNGKYDIMWKSVGNVRDIIDKILKDFFTKNTKMYITEYKGNLVIKSTETREEIIIKLKKKRSKEEYKVGVWTWAYYWAIQEIEIVDDEFKSLDEFVAKNDEIVADRIAENKADKENFEKSLEKFNMNFKEFYEVMKQYNCLSYTDKINYEKENGLYKGWL